MLSKLKPACILAFILFISGCTAAVKPDYNEVLSRWTRHTRIFHGLDARLYVYATYKGSEFTDAYIARYSSSFRLDEGYKKGLVERAAGEIEMYNDFFLRSMPLTRRGTTLKRTTPSGGFILRLLRASGLPAFYKQGRRQDPSSAIFPLS